MYCLGMMMSISTRTTSKKMLVRPGEYYYANNLFFFEDFDFYFIRLRVHIQRVLGLCDFWDLEKVALAKNYIMQIFS